MDKEDKLSVNSVWNSISEEFEKGLEDDVTKKLKEREKSTLFEGSVPIVLQNVPLKPAIDKQTDIGQKKNYSYCANFNNLYQNRKSKYIRCNDQRSNEVNLQRENKSENIKIAYKDGIRRNFKSEYSERKSYVQTKSMPFLTLRDLIKNTPNEILLTINNGNSGFMLILEDKNIGIEKMAFALIALGKSCLSDLNKNVSTMVTNVYSKTEFLLNSVQKYLVSLPSVSRESSHLESISYLITYLHKFQLIAPSSASEIISILLPMLKLTCQKFLTEYELYDDVTKMLDEICEQNEHYLKQYTPAEIKKSSKKELMQLQEPPENYRSIPVLPNVDDIHSSKTFLRPNIVHGKYLNAEHYLDVQYRLLREDYVKPLRDGIAEYLRLKKAGKAIKNSQDIRIYEDVHIVKQDFVNGSMVHIAEFCSKTFSKIKWEYSKRFLSGSLLCLSSDDFQTILFASVAYRMPEQLRRGLLLIRFEEITEEIINLNPLRSFVVIETTAYFEAYRHNLKALHELSEDIMPFKKYIVDTEKSISSPVYLTKSTTFDFRPLLVPLDNKFINQMLSFTGLRRHVTYEFPPDISKVAKSIHVLNDDNWPTESDLNLDRSQYLALKAAITQEFAIIQGPPGTGKTYIGLRIVQLLLHNMDEWWIKKINSLPILVVCYTNHALDQFLEGLMLFTNKIVRIGGRGSNEEVSKFQLSNLRRFAIITKEIPGYLRRSMWYNNIFLKFLKKEINDINCSVEKSMSVVLEEIELNPYIPPFQYESLKRIKDNLSFQLKDNGHLIHNWLRIHSKTEFSGVFRIAEEKKIPFIEPQLNTGTVADMEKDVDVESVGEADIEFIEAQRDIDTEEFAGVSFDIDVEEEVDIIDDDSEWRVQGGKKKHKQYIKNSLKYSQALDDFSAMRIKDVWNLELHHRWQLYKFWLQKYIEAKQMKCVHLQSQLRRLSQEISEIRMLEDMFILQNAHIVGMTTTGAAKYRDILIKLNPQILIVEEAAEILESHIITSLAPNTQHIILIGDHQQLRPSPTVHMLSVHYDLDISLFERMIKNNMDCFRLSIQHRMRPDIADLIVPHIYTDLKNHDSVTKYENIKGINKNMFFVTHKYNELQEGDSKSKVNEHEAKFLIKLCKYIIFQGYDPSQITVLTTYSGQLFVLKRLVTDELCKVKFTVVDNYQGEENDIILISFVRSNDEGEIGFLKIPNRVCVALSRARKGLYCIGNFELLAEKSDLWKNIVKTLQQKQCIGPSLQLMCQNHPGVCNVVANENDFESVPEGGCNRICKYRLNCGHTCSLMCHPYDMAHEYVQCQKQCTKFCSEGHQCNKKCFQKCGGCMYLVDKKMCDCGHIIKVQCHMQNNISCYEKCIKKLPCGHACTNECGKLCNLMCKEVIKIKSSICGHDVSVECCNKNDVRTLTKKCTHPCATVLECGHICKGTCKRCHQARLHIRCSQPCNRILVCGHECKSRCSKSCPPCTHPCENKCTHSKCPKTCGEPCNKCIEPCKWSCTHQKCSCSCGELCDRIPCNQPCPRLLRCRHPCISFCGEPCPKECRICDEQKVKEIFFGTEDDENAMYVCLVDCEHIFEINGLNQWMKTNTDDNIQIQMKSCPKCNTVIRTNLRFGNVVKRCLQNIEKIKHITFGNIDRNKKIQLDLLMLVNDLCTNSTVTDKELLAVFFEWKNILSSNRKINIQEITAMENMVNIFSEFITIVKFHKAAYVEQNSEVEENINTLTDFVVDSTNWILEFIKNEFLTASDQQLQQLAWEIHRLKLSMQLIKYAQEHRIVAHNPDFDSIISCLVHYASFCEKDVKTFSSSFKSMAEACSSSVISISDLEKQSILKVMNFTKGYWYQCPNGHVYCVLKYGGAMEVGRCNKCN